VTKETTVLEAVNLGKRFRRTWGLQHCTLTIPQGRVAALVGPNGSGKSTLLRMAAGLSTPSSGTLRVLGRSPTPGSDQLRERVGYLDQDRPLYKNFRVAEMLRFGKINNATWNMDVAMDHLAHLSIPLGSRVGELSGGQQAQVALTLCLAKQPELLLLDEPAASLDPVAREDLLRLLMRQVADSGSSVLLSTHALSDVAAICDFVVVLARARVVLADDTDYIVETHRLLSRVGEQDIELPPGITVIHEERNARGRTLLVRVELPFNDDQWRVDRPSLEEIVLAYLREGAPHDRDVSELDSGAR
jgi:ABC-2 type transport system ATP-binding protein